MEIKKKKYSKSSIGNFVNFYPKIGKQECSIQIWLQHFEEKTGEPFFEKKKWQQTGRWTNDNCETISALIEPKNVKQP